MVESLSSALGAHLEWTLPFMQTDCIFTYLLTLPLEEQTSQSHSLTSPAEICCGAATKQQQVLPDGPAASPESSLEIWLMTKRGVVWRKSCLMLTCACAPQNTLLILGLGWQTRVGKDNLSRGFPYMENSCLADPAGDKTLISVVARGCVFKLI